MKIDNGLFKKSSFLSIEKDMSIIMDKILSNDRIKKLLYYNTKDAFKKPNLTQEESLSLIGNQIRAVPKIKVDSNVMSYLVITFDNFSTNSSNFEFRNNLICFDILCHMDYWQLEDFQLRPFRIAAELDQMLDKKHLTGIGTLEFYGANQMLVSDEFAGVTLMYKTIHGGEDRVHALSPQEEAELFGR